MTTKPWIELEDLEDPNHPYAEYAIDMASFVLWSLTGRKYTGLKQITEQYICPEIDLPAGCSWTSERSYLDLSRMIYGFTIKSGAPLSCGGVRIPLRNTPVRSITEITVGGEVVDPSLYYIRGNEEVVLASSSGYGLCDAPVITYKYGVPPPYAGKLAAIELANEIVLSMAGASNCRLPERVSSVTRQGISISMVDPQTFLKEGQVGLYLVDLFIATANPTRSKKRPKIVSPDYRKGFTRR